MLHTKEEIQEKQTIIVVEAETEKREIKSSTDISEVFTSELAVGDVLIYRKYSNCHTDESDGEYAIIPSEYILDNTVDHKKIFWGVKKSNDENTDVLKEIESVTPIAICIDNNKLMALEEDSQPWAGNVYTGLYNTNYSWNRTSTKIIDDDPDNYNAEPWLSEIDGKTNTDKVMWLINDNIDTTEKTVEIILSHQTFAENLYNDILNQFVQTLGQDKKNEAQSEMDKVFKLNITEDKFSIFCYNTAYMSIVIDLVKIDEQEEEPRYSISAATAKKFFNKATKNTVENNQFEDNESYLWKDKTYDNNVYINKNNDAISLVIKYEYEKIDNTHLGEIYTSSNIIFGDAIKKINPLYSVSSNAFMYVNQYSTPGTKAGDWYLGSKEEMHCLMNYDTIMLINSVIGKIGLQEIDTIDNPNYLTSSPAYYNTNYCYSVYTNYRYMTAIDKRVICHVRPLLYSVNEQEIQQIVRDNG